MKFREDPLLPKLLLKKVVRGGWIRSPSPRLGQLSVYKGIYIYMRTINPLCHIVKISKFSMLLVTEAHKID